MCGSYLFFFRFFSSLFTEGLRAASEALSALVVITGSSVATFGFQIAVSKSIIYIIEND